MDVQKVLRNVSSYLIEYRENHELTQQEMASLVGLSISRYSELERNMGHSGLSLKSLMIIAGLEYRSLTDFLSDIELKNSRQVPKTGGSDEELTDLNAGLKNSVLRKMRKRSPGSSLVKNRGAWAFELLNVVLDGSNDDLINSEMMLLQYALCHQTRLDAKTRQAIKSRLNKLIKSK